MSKEYLWGEGWGTTVAEADNRALNDLISKISVQVSSKVSFNESEISKNEEVESNSNFSSIINTFHLQP